MSEMAKKFSRILALSIIFSLMLPNISYAMIATGTKEDEATKISIGKTYTTSNDENDMSADLKMAGVLTYDATVTQAPMYKFVVTTTGNYILTQKAKRLTSNSSDSAQGHTLVFYDSDFKVKWKSTISAGETRKETFNLTKGAYYIKFVSSPLYKAKGSISLKKEKGSSEKTQLNKEEVSLGAGKTLKLKLKNAPSGTIAWVSGKPSVAKVSSKGTVTAKKKGKAVIFAIIDNEAYTCTVTVE